MNDSASENLSSNAAKSCPTVNLSDRDATLQVIEDSILGLWAVVNNLSRIQPPPHKHYRVTIFGSGRIQKNTPLYQDVRRLASELTLMGCDIVTGGGSGLMEAANEGSAIADPSNQLDSIGIRIDLQSEQQTNPFVEKVYQHRTFFSRLHHFVLASDAFVVVPGGIGTTLEAFMIWQLLQVRQLHDTPLIAVGPMWSDLIAWATEYMIGGDLKLADPIDMTIPRCVKSMEEAIALLRESQAQWQQQSSILNSEF
jgi:predicted Rossmann-fold nucleotide-binding protein